ncbi:MAG: alpha/beta hydrolase [Candidatus Lumbricidophila eiseniae]|uniref:Alpha/beta hydrolase n=1 Tax=Candidatus Lumbricidiphila eiseniae TaxID=1969409 RepID=A0A2A6FT08_9MICO|nr:MAG: alpha/beta hydrolase [Candidatus Lumbricidophila eiseniae]
MTTSPYAAQMAAITVREHRGSVLGHSTAWWEYGSDAPSGTCPVAVFIHGFRGDHHGLEPIVAQFPDWRIIVPDLPGFGKTSPQLSQDIEGYVGWLVAFLRTAGVVDHGTEPSVAVPVTLLGHSFGSIVVAATVAAGLSPEHLILINPIVVSALEGPRGILTRLAVWYYQLAAGLPERAGLALLKNSTIVRIMSGIMAKTRDRKVRAWIHDQHDRYFSHFHDRRAVLAAFQTSVQHTVTEYADRITVPTLLIAGGRDDITPLAAHTAYVAAHPNAQLRVIPEVGHLIHYESPREAAIAIREFIGSARPSG